LTELGARSNGRESSEHGGLTTKTNGSGKRPVGSRKKRNDGKSGRGGNAKKTVGRLVVMQVGDHRGNGGIFSGQHHRQRWKM
jgi:hypothetical protein